MTLPSDFTLPDWRPRPLPPCAPVVGRWARLEPLAADRHGPDLWAALRGDETVWAYMADGPFPDEGSFSDWLRTRQAPGESLTFAVVDAACGRALGLLSLIETRPQFGVVEIGRVLFSPALQRSRAASGAIFLAAQLVFDGLGYRRLEWKCDARNAASRRAAERFGFRYEGSFKQHMIVKGRNRDTAWYAMIDRDWPSVRAAFQAWLAPENFDENGRQRTRLADLRR